MKTAIVTGACSGIGLALTRHLLSDVVRCRRADDLPVPQQWRVVLADINPAAYDKIAPTLPKSGERHIFVRTDVSDWSDMLRLFTVAYQWKDGGRVDFLASNAGIDDFTLKVGLLDEEKLEDIDSSTETEVNGIEKVKELQGPRKPDLKVLDVDLGAVLFGVKLLVYFSRKTRKRWAALGEEEPLQHGVNGDPADVERRITSKQSLDFQPKIIVTASMATQYPFFLLPQYTAAKHGCLGLVRALSPALFKYEGIRINCIMPGTVDTGLIPDEVLQEWPAEHITPMDTILRAYTELVDDPARLALLNGTQSDGVQGVVHTGCAVECTGKTCFYREPVPFKDDSMRFVWKQSMEEGILGQMAQRAKVARKKIS
jgi:15-hydroxyprostaglandin dehydrogenase (NAD)